VENAQVRHNMSPTARVEDGCDDQFRTMVINPFYKDKLAGKNVCIIDDFTRHGTSAETVRHMLKQAGVNKILFIAMGKFKANAVYNKYTYKLSGDVYSGLKYRQVSREQIVGNINPKANKDFIESLGKWI
jgi:hypoxanthine phosphoribosyltransferase